MLVMNRRENVMNRR